MDAVCDMLTHAKALATVVKRVEDELHTNADALQSYALREYAYRALLARWAECMEWMKTNAGLIPNMDQLYAQTRAALGRELVSEDSHPDTNAEIDGAMNNDS